MRRSFARLAGPAEWLSRFIVALIPPLLMLAAFHYVLASLSWFRSAVHWPNQATVDVATLIALVFFTTGWLIAFGLWLNRAATRDGGSGDPKRDGPRSDDVPRG